MGGLVGRLVLLSVLLHRAPDIRICDPRNSERTGTLQGNAWMGEWVDALGLRTRPVDQWQFRRQVGRARHDARGRGAVVRRELDDELCNRLRWPSAGVGFERLLPGDGVCARKQAAFKLVG